MEDCKCPYCGADQEICHDDGHGYEEDRFHQQQCGKCRKYYIFTTSISYYYETQKADCLNDSKHKWKPNNCYPKCATKMVCDTCDERREPTTAEKIEYKIPTWDEEMKEVRK